MQGLPRDITLGRSYSAYGPIGGLPSPEWTVYGGTRSLFPAATIARSSIPTDEPANTYVPDRLEPTLNYGRSLFNGADPRNVANPPEGVVSLDDLNGSLDYLLDYSWDGAEIVMYRGFSDEPFRNWTAVGRFAGANIIGDMESIKIRLRDFGWRLNTLLHTEYYQGTGGLEGEVGLKGRWKPYAAGWCFNIEPVLIDAAHQVYQFNFISSQAVIECRHGGVPLTFHADYPTYEDLIAATVPAGYYATCLAKSLVLPSITIALSIRLDVKGDAEYSHGFPPPNNRAAIVRRIAVSYGDSNLNPDTQLDIASINAFEGFHSAIVGFFWDREITKLNAIKEVVSGVLGWSSFRPDGRLALGFARSLDAEDSVQTIEFQSYGMGLIEMVDFVPPRAGTIVGWRKNYGPESRDQLAGVVDAETGQILSEDSRWGVTVDSGLLIVYPTAETVKIQGNFWYEADALQEAGRQQALMGVPRRRWRWTMEIDAFSDMLDQVFTITNVNRLKLGSSKLLLCVGLDSTGFGAVTTEWWG